MAHSERAYENKVNEKFQGSNSANRYLLPLSKESTEKKNKWSSRIDFTKKTRGWIQRICANRRPFFR